ncbi:MAG: hypothetical protein KatS3mg056_3306 [Chloroflexus sp.]|nr:MAG: hypothetical protein KatS3mg056_3306 [Chloroflexus sp.]
MYRSVVRLDYFFEHEPLLTDENMNRSQFLEALRNEVATFNPVVSTQTGDWIVKGFIDVARNIYTISADTKVISKLLEILLFPRLAQFAEQNQLKMFLSE